MDSASAADFDRHIDNWKAEQQQPWMVLRYNLEHAHVKRHGMDTRPGETLRILDAGGGNGQNAIRLAREGHHVSVVDYSAEMLADGTTAAREQRVSELVTFQQAALADIPDLFPEAAFDLVLCHNVLQYVDDVAVAVQSLTRPLRSGGWISVVVPNRHAELYKAGLRELDLERAGQLLAGEKTRATLFGTTMRAFAPDELDEALLAVHCQPVALYGIRCLCDWLPNEPKADKVFMAQLEALEMALADKFPYYLLARFFQILAQKQP